MTYTAITYRGAFSTGVKWGATSPMTDVQRKLDKFLASMIAEDILTLPDDILEMHERLERIISKLEELPTSATAELDRMARRLADGGHVRQNDLTAARSAEDRRYVWSRAARRLAVSYFTTLTGRHEEILSQVDAALVAPALAKLRAAAECEWESISGAARAGDTDAVMALAATDDRQLTADLDRADVFRQRLMGEGHAAPRWPWTVDGRTLPELIAEGEGTPSALVAALRSGVTVLPYVRGEREPEDIIVSVPSGLLEDDVFVTPASWSGATVVPAAESAD